MSTHLSIFALVSLIPASSPLSLHRVASPDRRVVSALLYNSSASILSPRSSMLSAWVICLLMGKIRGRKVALIYSSQNCLYYTKDVTLNKHHTYSYG